MNDEKFNDTLIIKFSMINKPIPEMLTRIVNSKGITISEYVEDILVKHVKDLGYSWIEPDIEPEGELIIKD